MLSAACAALLVAAPAAAHDALESSDPAAGSAVTTLPGALTLTFSGALQSLTPDDTFVDVFSPSGEDVAVAEEEIDGAVLRQPLEPAPEPGVYTVEWRAVSSDGHPIAQAFSFTVESVSAAAPSAEAVPPADGEGDTAEPSRKPVTTPSVRASSPTGAPAPADSDEGPGDMLPWILLGVSAAAIAAALISLLVARARRGPADRGAGEDGSGASSGR